MVQIANLTCQFNFSHQLNIYSLPCQRTKLSWASVSADLQARSASKYRERESFLNVRMNSIAHSALLSATQFGSCVSHPRPTDNSRQLLARFYPTGTSPWRFLLESSTLPLSGPSRSQECWDYVANFEETALSLSKKKTALPLTVGF